MLEAVRKVAAGQIYVGQEMMPCLVKARSINDGDPLSPLTPGSSRVFYCWQTAKPSIRSVSSLT